MTDPLAPILVPLSQIDEAALPRDRSGLDAEPLDELIASLVINGLRQPIEIWRFSEPRPPHTFGLISGFRRLAAFRSLLTTYEDKTRWQAIPAFIRTPATYAEAFAAMVEENEVRADLSPFEKGKLLVTAVRCEIFPSVEAAVDSMYAGKPRYQRARLRTLARFAEEMDGLLTAPEKLTQAQAFRVAAAFDAGFGEVIDTALNESSLKDPATQWEILKPILAEAEDCARANKPHVPGRRPRRVARIRGSLTVRRERTRDGWCLHFTGREATGGMLDDVLENIELMYSRR
jgi:ParB family transcriptional regulator, chromosome partitioning protein